MADTFSFTPPAWLDDQSADTIHQRMMNNLPDDIDDTEGGFPWDLTKPTALEKAELLEFEMMEALKTMHYMFAYGIYLDYHAAAYGLTRRSAVKATGNLSITGSPGTIIPAFFQFAVPASGSAAAVIFFAVEETTIGVDGTATIPVEAQTAGTIGNVAANTISIMVQPIGGITSITNSEAMTGGTAIEDDDTLRERIKEYCETADVSFAGCDADYKRWAQEVNGVGDVTVMPEWNGAGTVKVVILDTNGEPANSTLVDAVYNYIVSPSDRAKRLAPIGATVSVVAPTTVLINVACNLTLAAGADYTTVTGNIRTALNAYFHSTEVIASNYDDDKVIKRNRVGSIIMGTDGVEDFENLTLNGETSNLWTKPDEYPELGVFTTSGV